MTREIWLQEGGLMEDPQLHWEPFFKTDKETVLKACEARAEKDPEFAKYYKSCNGTPTYWGWRMKFKEDISPNFSKIPDKIW